MTTKTKNNHFTARFQDGTEVNFTKDISLLEIVDMIRPCGMDKIILARVNNQICSLLQKIKQDSLIEWIPLNTTEGMRAYHQSLCLILIRSFEDLYPHKRLLIDHSLGKGYYCELKSDKCISRRMVKILKKRMHEIVNENSAIEPAFLSQKEFTKYFQNICENSSFLFGPKRPSELAFYRSGNTIEYLDTPLLPKTGLLISFDLQHWPPGMILCFPTEDNLHEKLLPIRQKKLFNVFHEYGQWINIQGIQHVSDVNKLIRDNKIQNLIKIAEALHEKRIAEIADMLYHKHRHSKVILIAGPSSSGKTTFTKRLKIQLHVNGLVPLTISLDDYFLDWGKTPKDDNGNYDFESIAALDIDRLNTDLKQLLKGKEVQLPRYDFKHGKSIPGPRCQLATHQPVLIEGLHSLNDKITTGIPRRNKFKIYVSVLTQLNITDHLRVPTSDIRFLRRLIRGHLFRGHSATRTIERWPLVRDGEERNIFPFQEESDAIFNSSLTYELPVLKAIVSHLLETIRDKSSTFPEAQRLLQLLHTSYTLSPEEVPPNSILREFIGGSNFNYGTQS